MFFNILIIKEALEAMLKDADPKLYYQIIQKITKANKFWKSKDITCFHLENYGCFLKKIKQIYTRCKFSGWSKWKKQNYSKWIKLNPKTP